MRLLLSILMLCLMTSNSFAVIYCKRFSTDTAVPCYGPDYPPPGGGGSITIGDPVSGSTNYTTLYVDGSGNLANSFILPDNGGAPSVDILSRQLMNGPTNISLSWTENYMHDGADVLSMNWSLRTLYDNSGAVSQDYNLRKLYEHFGAVNIDYSFANGAYLAGILDATGGLIIDPSGYKAYNPTGQISINWNDSLLNDFTGVLSENYNNRTLYDHTGSVASMNYDGRALLDSGGTGAADWSIRHLLASDGGTIPIDWTNTINNSALLSFGSGTAYFSQYIGSNASNNRAIDANGRYLYADDGVTLLIDWTNSGTAGNYNFIGGKLSGDGSFLTGVTAANANYLYDGTPGNLSADGVNRVLYATNGTTPIIDWSDTYNASAALTFGGGAAYFYNATSTIDSSGNINALSLNVTTGGFVNFDSATVGIKGAGVLSIDPNARIIYATDGTTPIIDWTNSYNGLAVLSFQGQSPYFSTGISSANTANISLDTNTRIAYAYDGTTATMDWSNTFSGSAAISFDGANALALGAGTVVFGNGAAGINPTSGKGFFQGLVDTSNILSISQVDRQLFASNGSTILVDWTNTLNSGVAISFDGANVNNFGANSTTFYNARAIIGTTAGAYFYLLADGSAIPSIDQTSRILYAADGTTKVIDWHTDTTNVNSAGYWFDTNNSDRITGIGTGLTALAAANIIGYTTSGNDVLHGNSSWGPIDLASGVTGVLPVANGGTGQATPVILAGTFTATGAVTTTFTVTIGTTQPGTTYKVTTEGSNALSSAVHYVNNKTTTTFDVVYLAGLTGSVAFDWILTP